MLAHTGQFGHPPQGDLPPAAPHLGGAQGLDQVARLLLQFFFGNGHLLQMLAQASVGLLPGLLHGLHLLGIAIQGILQGGHQGLHGLLPLGQIPLGLGLKFFQGGPGQIQKLLIIAAQGFRGQGLEGIAHFLRGFIQEGQLFFHGQPLLMQGGFQFGLHLLQAADLLPQPEVLLFPALETIFHLRQLFQFLEGRHLLLTFLNQGIPELVQLFFHFLIFNQQMVVRKFLGSNPFFQHRQFGLAGLDGFGGLLGQADLQQQAHDDDAQDGPNQKGPDRCMR